jgi:aminopeptidase N
VGNDQANEPWLDEAVTQYVTGLAFLDRYGSAGWQGYVDSWKARWARVDNADLPIGLPAGDYQGREYSAIVYGRGPLFLQALAEEMGQSTFDAFLSDYVQQNEWGIATSSEFKKLAETHCSCDLSNLFSQWVLPE